MVQLALLALVAATVHMLSCKAAELNLKVRLRCEDDRLS